MGVRVFCGGFVLVLILLPRSSSQSPGCGCGCDCDCDFVGCSSGKGCSEGGAIRPPTLEIIGGLDGDDVCVGIADVNGTAVRFSWILFKSNCFLFSTTCCCRASIFVSNSGDRTYTNAVDQKVAKAHTYPC